MDEGVVLVTMQDVNINAVLLGLAIMLASSVVLGEQYRFGINSSPQARNLSCSTVLIWTRAHMKNCNRWKWAVLLLHLTQGCRRWLPLLHPYQEWVEIVGVLAKNASKYHLKLSVFVAVIELIMPSLEDLDISDDVVTLSSAPVFLSSGGVLPCTKNVFEKAIETRRTKWPNVCWVNNYSPQTLFLSLLLFWYYTIEFILENP